MLEKKIDTYHLSYDTGLDDIREAIARARGFVPARRVDISKPTIEVLHQGPTVAYQSVSIKGSLYWEVNVSAGNVSQGRGPQMIIEKLHAYFSQRSTYIRDQ